MSGSIARGRFVHYDLLTADTDAAVDFYTRLAGWGTMPWHGEGASYTMWTNDGVPMGGVMPLPDEAKAVDAPPHWIAYVMVPDTSETVASTEDLGGSVVVPATDIPNPPKTGDFSWNELATTDWEAAFEFYHAVFGWEKTEAMDMGEMGTYQMYGRCGSSLGGIFNKPAEVEGPPEWLYYIMVEDANQSALTLQMLGGQVMNGPSVLSRGRVPKGTRPQVVEPVSPPTRPAPK
jgi:predicted enzyme related to lactoylglutathione lyase